MVWYWDTATCWKGNFKPWGLLPSLGAVRARSALSQSIFDAGVSLIFQPSHKPVDVSVSSVPIAVLWLLHTKQGSDISFKQHSTCTNSTLNPPKRKGGQKKVQHQQLLQLWREQLCPAPELLTCPLTQKCTQRVLSCPFSFRHSYHLFSP